MASVTGGDRLDARLREIGEKLSAQAVVRVGFLEGATYPDGTSVALIAAVQNFGSMARGIPPRPFFSNMIRDKSDGWGDKLAAIMRNNGGDVRRSLELMGQGIAGQLRQSIVNTNSPPLAPETIARKGFEKPLIDTAVMLQAVDSEVVDAV